MRYFLILLLTFLSNVLLAQSLNDVRYFEIVSEIQDTMIVLNKNDVNKINKTFHEKRILDSVLVINEEIIYNLQVESKYLKEILDEQKAIVLNEKKINSELINKYESEISDYKKLWKREKYKRIGWQSATGVSIVTFLLILLI